MLPAGRRRLLHGVEQLGRRRLPFAESVERDPRPAAQRQEQPRLRRQHRGGVVLPETGQGVARERLRRRRRRRLAEGRGGLLGPPRRQRLVPPQQRRQHRRPSRLLRRRRPPRPSSLQHHAPARQRRRGIRPFSRRRELLPGAIVLFQGRQCPRQEQPSLHLHDAASRRRLIEQSFGRRRLAAPQQRPRLQQRPLVAGRHLLVAAHRLPDLLGPVHAAHPPQQVHQPRHGLRRPRVSFNTASYSDTASGRPSSTRTRPSQYAASASSGAPSAWRASRIASTSSGSAAAAFPASQCSQPRANGRSASRPAGAGADDSTGSIRAGSSRTPAAWAVERLAHAIQGQPHRRLRRRPQRRFHHRRGVAQAVGPLIHRRFSIFRHWLATRSRPDDPGRQRLL